MSSIGYHGSLTPRACLIDRNWMVKLSDYGISNSINRWVKKGSIVKKTPTNEEEKLAEINSNLLINSICTFF